MTFQADQDAGPSTRATVPLPNSLEYWAAIRPHEIAIVDGVTALTWEQWNRAACRFAHVLEELGLKVGEVLAIRSQIRHEWQIAHQAAAKLGCAVVPFNWRLTPDESRHILADSAARLLILDDEDLASFSSAYEGLGLRAVIGIEGGAEGVLDFSTLMKAAPDTPIVAQAKPRLIIYTSGTTGRPKGVMTGAQHVDAEWTQYLKSIELADPLHSGERLLLTLPMHHGAGPGACARALASGNTLYMMRRFEPEAALAAIQQYRINSWSTVPTMLKRIAGLPPQVLSKYDLSSLRALRTGGAPVPLALKEWVSSYFGPILHESYGATEVGLISLLAPEQMKVKPSSSGRLYTSVHIRVKDEEGRTLPPGEAGILWIKTPANIRNYLNGPPLDASTIDDEGFFQIGDVGYLDSDGYLFITDRQKDMIISGGVNIYPAEIEAAFSRHPGIQDVAVIGLPDEEFGEMVKAFVEPKPGVVLRADEVRAFVEPLLASYKRPRTIEFVGELPRSTMGKVLKRDLRNPYWKDQERNV